MRVLKTRAELLAWRAEFDKIAESSGVESSEKSNAESSTKSNRVESSKAKTLGFVPTMGALHNGHLSLMERSIAQNHATIVSIFVNPTQFGANEDFDKYPRVLEKDIEFCKSVGVSVIFAPSEREMYGLGESNVRDCARTSDIDSRFKKQDCAKIYGENETILLPPQNLASVFEGALRENHFSGVLRVVMKFFNLVRPHNAYFGQKDAQQLLIIKKMVSDLFMSVNIVGCPIVRDSNHLALSSRNAYLSAESYKKALQIPQAIFAAKAAFESGENKVDELESLVLGKLGDFEVDYCKIVDYDLKPLDCVVVGGSILLLAVRVGGVRLLDNLWF